MADVFSPARRSQIMSRIKGGGNQATELRLIEIFRDHKIRGWRRGAVVFGRPDFTFPAIKLAVFVDGCFWHRCPIHGSVPATNRMFWIEKLKRNENRDALVSRNLKRSGWTVLRIWQHELRKPDRVARRVSRSLNQCKMKDDNQALRGK